jgi:hypothetical protein
MQNIKCTISDRKEHFVRQIANRLHGNITESTEHDLVNDLTVKFGDAKEAYLFDRFMFILNQPFA